MTRLAVVLTALVAVLFTAPAAAIAATTFTVTSNGDAPDADLVADPSCDSDPAAGVQCTLRSAIQQANATAGSDLITFDAAGQAPAPMTPLPPVLEALTIDGGGNTTVTFAVAASGTLLDLNAANVVVKAITLTGGGAGTMVDLRGSSNRLDAVMVRDTPATGVRLSADGARVDGSRVANGSATGIVVSGGSTTVSATTVTGTGSRGIDVVGANAAIVDSEIAGGQSDGIRLASTGASVGGGRVHDNAGNGVLNEGQNNTVSRVVLYANGGKPIANSGGANGGIAPPQNLRIGPRRADGSLPLTGTASAGTLELWQGNPASASAPAFFDTFSVSGDFTYNFPSEPAPGTVFSASVNGSGLGSSEFASVAVPDDVISPEVTFARALDTSNVRVDFTEPVDAGSVQVEDFKLAMAGLDRTITGASVAPDGRYATLSSSGWKAGEAGTVEVTGVGAINDTSGNAMLTAPRLRVAAAPGDFLAPLASRLRVPKSICLTRGRKCRRPGMVLSFVTDEPGKARMVIKRSNKTVGSRVYSKIVAGLNTLKFNGRLNARKLRAGRYRLLIYVQDGVGNVTDQPPIQLFSVRRVTK